jgi:Predicted membrane protein (DUF2142)
MSLWLEIFRRFTGKPAVIAFFILCALPVGLLTALVTPPGQSPDEPKHLARAAGLLHGAVLGERKIGVDFDQPSSKPALLTGMKVDAGLYQASHGWTSEIADRNIVTTQDFLAMRAEPADHDKVFISAPNTATYFPVAYLPAALGLALGLAVKAPPFACFLLARLCMLAAFLVLGALALWVTAFGEAALLVVLIMPMTLFLAGTLNQDGVLIAAVCLACAAITRNTPAFRFLGVAVFVLFLGAKPPYILMLGAFLLPLSGAGFWRRVRDVAIACVPVLIWVALITAFVVVPFGREVYQPGPLYTGDRSVWMDHTDEAGNLHILLAQPSRLISLPWYTEQIWGLQILQSMIGTLGLLRISLANSVYWAWTFCGFAALAGLVLSRREVVVSAGTAAVNFLVIALLLSVTYWLMMLMFYLNWSYLGLGIIDGMQGRYLLPLLPFLLFAIPGFRWRFTLPPLLPALPAIAMGIFDIGYIPMKLVWNYYLH